jgi:opacity protein-like surface antigen
VLAALVTVPALAAQSPVSLGIGGGVTLPRDDLEATTDRGYHGMATLRVGLPLLPVHLRADLMHGQLAGSPDPAGDLQITSGTVNVGYDVVPLAVVSVYVVGGAGYYWTKLNESGAERARHGGWNAGAGLRVSLGALRLFAEARYHAIRVDGGDAHVVPVTIGIMF